MARRSKIDIVIGSSVRGALSGIKKVGAGVGELAKKTAALARTGATVGIAAVGTGIAAAGVGAVKAAADIETLELRLKAVLGSAEKAEKAFAETFNFFLKTPLDLKPLIEARILLSSFGLTGVKELKATSEAASALGRDVQDIALAVGSLESETLKRLGIQLRTNGDQFRFVFRDRAQKEITRTITGIQNARKELLNIFKIRFGGLLDEASVSLQGRISSLGGLLFAAGGKVAEGVNATFADALGGINALLEQQLAGGSVIEAIRKRFESAFEGIAGLFSFEGLKTFGQELAANLGVVIDRLQEGFRRLSRDFTADLREGLLLTFAQLPLLTKKQRERLTNEATNIGLSKFQREVPVSELFPFPGFGGTVEAGRANLDRLSGIGADPVFEAAKRIEQTFSRVASFAIANTNVGLQATRGGVSGLFNRERFGESRFTLRNGRLLVRLDEGEALRDVLSELPANLASAIQNAPARAQ